jgi:hypothetical protein
VPPPAAPCDDHENRSYVAFYVTFLEYPLHFPRKPRFGLFLLGEFPLQGGAAARVERHQKPNYSTPPGSTGGSRGSSAVRILDAFSIALTALARVASATPP